MSYMIRKLLKKLVWKDRDQKSEDYTEKVTHESSSPSVNKSGEHTKVSQSADITTYANSSQPRNEVKESMKASQPALKQDPKTIKWKNVYVFISSTFNDMHAERDYLVKNVFPHLQEWCESRKLRLVDIDLRWGVTEQDALYRKNVVKVCLNRIDECRPFFLCFLGQRRGWVPKEEEISQETFDSFPDLRPYTGSTSVTEMEILHALINPLHQSKKRDPGKNSEYYEKVKHAFFYFRDPSYFSNIPKDPPLLRQTYTNEGIEDQNEREIHEQELKKWREEKIPNSFSPVHSYQAKWNTGASTPELNIPLQCPSTEPANIKEWRDKWWEKAGVLVSSESTNIEDIKDEAEKAKIFNKKLCKGRLVDFKCGDTALSNVIIEDLQKAITSRYPDHIEIKDKTDLQKELDQQEQFLFLNSEGFFERKGDFDELENYVNGDSNNLFVLTALGGMGKSMLLAKWVDRFLISIENVEGQSIHFRFIGASDRSTTIYSLIRFLLCEMKETEHKFDDEIPEDPEKLLEAWPKLLEAAGEHGKTVIVIDALDQLETGLSNLNWLPPQLPPNIKLIVSFKRGEQAAEELCQQLKTSGQIIRKVKPFEEIEDRKKLVHKYLSQYLKDLDEQHLHTLIQSPGASNPLYLKVVLSELRVFGAFSNLGKKIRADFGKTPVSAFQGVLNRLETDPVYSKINPGQAPHLLFGLMAHARHGLSADELASLLIQELRLEDTEEERKNAKDTVYLFLRQVRPFLARREGRYDFFYESFKSAAKERYVENSFEEHLHNDSSMPDKPCPERYVEKSHEEHLPNRFFECCWHRMLAKYFRSLPTWQENVSNIEEDYNRKPTVRKVAELPYHQTYGQWWSELEAILCDIEFIEAKCIAKMVFDLLQDCDVAIKLHYMPTVVQIKRAVSLSLSGILARPHLTMQLVYNRLTWFDPLELKLGSSVKKARLYLDQQPFWISLESPLNQHSDDEIQVIEYPYVTSPIQSISPKCDAIAVISPAGDKVAIFDITYGKLTEIRTIQSSSVSALCLRTDPLLLAYIDSQGNVIVDGTRNKINGRAGEKILAYYPDLGYLFVREDNSLTAWDPINDNQTILAKGLPYPLITLKISILGEAVLFVAGFKDQIVGIARRSECEWTAKTVPYKGPLIVDADLDHTAKFILVASIDHRLQIIDLDSEKGIAQLCYRRREDATVRGSPQKCALVRKDEAFTAFIITRDGHVASWDWPRDSLKRYEDYRKPEEPLSDIHCAVESTTDMLVLSTQSHIKKYTKYCETHHDETLTFAVNGCVITDSPKVITISERANLIKWLHIDSLSVAFERHIFAPTAISECRGSDDAFVGNKQGYIIYAPSNPEKSDSVIPVISGSISSILDIGDQTLIVASRLGEVGRINILEDQIEIIRQNTINKTFLKVLPAGKTGLFWSLYRDDTERSKMVVSLTRSKNNEEIVTMDEAILRDMAVSPDGNTICIAGNYVKILQKCSLGWSILYRKEVPVSHVAMINESTIVAILLLEPWLEIWKLSPGLPMIAAMYLSDRVSSIYVRDEYIVVGYISGNLLSARLRRRKEGCVYG